MSARLRADALRRTTDRAGGDPGRGVDVEEARAAAKAFQEKQNQQAIAEAEQIVAKAREAAQLDHARMLAELKKEVARLVVDTTAKVSGKVLTSEDQRRLSEEASREIAA